MSSAAVASAVPPLPLWRTSPARVARLVVGLWVFGTGDALLVASQLGNSPWTVFAEGLSLHTPLTIGASTIVISLAIFAIWVPLRVRPGLGTVLNVIVIGIAIDVTLLLVDTPGSLIARGLLLGGGIALIGAGSGLYLGTAHGPGPRDGLMTGLHRATGRPVSLVRGAIEVTALTIGWLLGGTLGIGTVTFALLIGPAVQLGLAADARWRAAASRRQEPLSAPTR
ncbi:YitT family protein [Euzebya sp.]|uniref:membrane protein YczE n=1 Tax=Euzebya sp. TaxID=1971409 RepID=UPI003515D5F0